MNRHFSFQAPLTSMLMCVMLDDLSELLKHPFSDGGQKKPFSFPGWVKMSLESGDDK